MGRLRAWYLTALVVAALLGTAAPASAEMFLDLYVGASFFGDPDFSIESEDAIIRERDRGSADTNITGGARFGYWFSELGIPFLGVAADVSYFEPTFSGPTGSNLIETKVQVIPMTPLVMLRLPILAAPEYPGGRFYIYGAAGPGFFWTEHKTTLLGRAERISADTVEVGVDARAGLAWHFLPNWKAFFEYRFTHFSIGKEFDRGVSVEADLDVHHALFGIGYTFR
jgi:opacity protein-like surface antigen